MELILQENSDWIRRGQYQKAYRTLTKYFVEPREHIGSQVNAIEQMQICRRLLHISVRLMKKFFQKFHDKSHRIQMLLVRGMEIVVAYNQHISAFLSLQRRASQSPQSQTIAPTSRRHRSMVDLSSLIDKIRELQSKLESTSSVDYSRGAKWIAFHQQCFLRLTAQMLQLHLRYYKLVRAAAEASVVGQRLDDCIARPLVEDIRCQMAHIHGNLYLENNVIPIAMTYYEKALDISQVGMCRMLDDFEKLKVSLHPNFWAQLSRYCQLTIMHLDMIAYCCQVSGQFTHGLDALKLAKFIYKILAFAPNSSELGDFLERRLADYQETYSTIILEELEITKIMKRVIHHHHHPVEEATLSLNHSQFEITQQELYVKHNYDRLSRTQFIINRTPVKPQTANYFFKGRHMKQVKSIHFKNSSTSTQNQSDYNATMQTIDAVKILDASTPAQRTPKSSLYTQSTFKPRSVKHSHSRSSPQSFLSQLLLLENKTLNQDIKWDQQGRAQEKKETEPDKRIRRQQSKNSVQPRVPLLDQQIGAYIEGTFKEVCLPMNEVMVNCRKHLDLQTEMHKEIPNTLQVLGMQRVLGALVSAEKEKSEFNKHLEFNVLEYFDYLTTNKESALMRMKSTQQVKTMRRAHYQNNLVLKSKVKFEETMPKPEATEPRQEPNGHQKLQKILYKHRKDLDLRETYHQHKQDLKQSKLTHMSPTPQREEKDLSTVVGMANEGFLAHLALNEQQAKQIEREDREVRQVTNY